MTDGRRPRGRPRTGTVKTPVSVRLPEPEHDALARCALKHRMSVAALIRRGIARELLYLKKSESDSSAVG